MFEGESPPRIKLSSAQTPRYHMFSHQMRNNSHIASGIISLSKMLFDSLIYYSALYIFSGALKYAMRGSIQVNIINL